VIREAMRGKGMVALGRVALSKRERSRFSKAATDFDPSQFVDRYEEAVFATLKTNKPAGLDELGRRPVRLYFGRFTPDGELLVRCVNGPVLHLSARKTAVRRD
jgi:hypothetical protein